MMTSDGRCFNHFKLSVETPKSNTKVTYDNLTQFCKKQNMETKIFAQKLCMRKMQSLSLKSKQNSNVHQAEDKR